MTLDKTLQKIIQRAEFDRVKLVEQISQHNQDHPLDIEFKKTLTSNFLWAADKENARLMPIIQGLCEEVQRKQSCIDGFFKLIDDNILVRNTDDDHDFKKYFKQGARLMGHLTACKSTSAFEKLGGGE